MGVKQDIESEQSHKTEEKPESSTAPLDAANGVSDALTPPADSKMEVHGDQDSESKVISFPSGSTTSYRMKFNLTCRACLLLIASHMQVTLTLGLQAC